MRKLSVVLCAALLMTSCSALFGERLTKQGALELINGFVRTGLNNSLKFRFGPTQISAGQDIFFGSRDEIVREWVKIGFATANMEKQMTMPGGKSVEVWKVLPTDKLQKFITKRSVTGVSTEATVQLTSDPINVKIDSVEHSGETAIVHYSYDVRINEAGAAARDSGGFRWGTADQKTKKWRAEFTHVLGEWQLIGLPRSIRKG